MTVVQSVEARTLPIPLANPIAFARRAVTCRHYTVVRVRAEGVEGLGFCYAGTDGGFLTTAAVRELIAPRVVGEDPHRVRGIWEDLHQDLILHGRAGSVTRAQSAVDIALWDLRAKLAEQPLWRYLGAVEKESVPAYASGGYYAEGKSPADLAAEMQSYVEMGFGAVKMKVGRETPAGDEARLAAVREAVGPDVLVMLDANNAWRDLPTALRHLRRLEPLDPYWIEEPFLPDDVDNHARLAKATNVTVATGELAIGYREHLRLIEAGAAQILQTDAAVCGGITEYLRIAATADSHGLTMAPHWFHDLHVHLVASCPNARFVEFFPDSSVLNLRPAISPPIEVMPGGRLRLPESPGLGFELLPAELDRHADGEWS